VQTIKRTPKTLNTLFDPLTFFPLGKTESEDIMEYTKGKWEVALEPDELSGDLYITANNDLTIIATAYRLSSMENSTFRDEAKANARLIAAAPALLDACKDVIDGLAKPGRIQLTQGTWDKLQAAIAAAGGE